MNVDLNNANVLTRLLTGPRRRQRLAVFGLTVRDVLPTAHLKFRLACAREGCAPYAIANTAFAESYRLVSDGALVAPFKSLAAVTDLTLFRTLDPYLQEVARETDGKYRRSANKAKREGYFTGPIAVGTYQRSLFDIKHSKDVRSHGRMSEMAGGPIRPSEDLALAFDPPSCPEHWRIDWGLFHSANPTMWGFASLTRSGNLVNLAHMMAHGDVLTTGGMKLMQFDIMSWLLGRLDPCVIGLDYLLHGAIEDGGEGMTNWRRYVGQRPHVLHLIDPARARLPADFDPRAYLELNPDVKAAGVDPRKHYLRGGILDGRAYKMDGKRRL